MATKDDEHDRNAAAQARLATRPSHEPPAGVQTFDDWRAIRVSASGTALGVGGPEPGRASGPQVHPLDEGAAVSAEESATFARMLSKLGNEGRPPIHPAKTPAPPSSGGAVSKAIEDADRSPAPPRMLETVSIRSKPSLKKRVITVCVSAAVALALIVFGRMTVGTSTPPSPSTAAVPSNAQPLQAQDPLAPPVPPAASASSPASVIPSPGPSLISESQRSARPAASARGPIRAHPAATAPSHDVPSKPLSDTGAFDEEPRLTKP